MSITSESNRPLQLPIRSINHASVETLEYCRRRAWQYIGLLTLGETLTERLPCEDKLRLKLRSIINDSEENWIRE